MSQDSGLHMWPHGRPVICTRDKKCPAEHQTHGALLGRTGCVSHGRCVHEGHCVRKGQIAFEEANIKTDVFLLFFLAISWWHSPAAVCSRIQTNH